MRVARGGQWRQAIEKLVKAILIPVNRAGWPFIAGFALVALLLWTFSGFLGFLGLIATLWCLWFFRDPERMTPVRGGLVVSAADGVVCAVTQAPPPADLGLADRPLTRISVFLDIFDVHVNRIPIDGIVRAVRYRPGTFLNASLDKASEDNERNAVRIDTPEGPSIVVVQIAGLIARRIKSWIGEGEAVRAGARFGLIRFGSRVDVYLPDGVAPLVSPGQRCIAGETVIADLRAQEPARTAERR
jgi:phosphatidylserine decarboxylase